MTDEANIHCKRMSKAIGNWLTSLQSHPNWDKANHEKIADTLWFDEPYARPNLVDDIPFNLPPDVESQRILVLNYLHMQRTIESLKECEYYFRRYPFNGTPVTRYDHFSNICEMYFNRFYEFRERLKRFFDALKTVNPTHRIDGGRYIKVFDRNFDAEIRERHGVHHRERYVDIAIDRLFMTHIVATEHPEKGWDKEHRRAYRKAANIWVKRVRRRAGHLDLFLDLVAKVSLDACEFLG